MDVVLRVLLERVELVPTEEPGEDWSYRGIVWAPGRDGRAVVRRRTREPLGMTGEAQSRTLVTQAA
jgi:hypothetical protein